MKMEEANLSKTFVHFYQAIRHNVTNIYYSLYGWTLGAGPAVSFHPFILMNLSRRYGLLRVINRSIIQCEGCSLRQYPFLVPMRLNLHAPNPSYCLCSLMVVGIATN
jgi:hypothetical protein